MAGATDAYQAGMVGPAREGSRSDSDLLGIGVTIEAVGLCPRLEALRISRLPPLKPERLERDIDETNELLVRRP